MTRPPILPLPQLDLPCLLTSAMSKPASNSSSNLPLHPLLEGLPTHSLRLPIGRVLRLRNPLHWKKSGRISLNFAVDRLCLLPPTSVLHLLLLLLRLGSAVSHFKSFTRKLRRARARMVMHLLIRREMAEIECHSILFGRACGKRVQRERCKMNERVGIQFPYRRLKTA